MKAANVSRLRGKSDYLLSTNELNVEKVCGPHDKSDSIRQSYDVITTIKDLIERPKLI